ncbi:signal peptidase I [Novibacillus thermophilus]|uniref:Signal peptidase I n=1 Tax=Novibacillus thermophilus TaxID=1471761 RepID=A0A1U9K6E5_9BACL|nr:signal peptidase I [Novibacillus thermophilus]AQS55592.1 signal peptidase I [Novibacillus thermophilus]
MSESVSRSSNRVKSSWKEFWEWTKALLIAIALAVIIRTFLFAPFLVDGQSMVPNLADNERLIVNKLIYFIREPERGEILVFHATAEKDYIKRVIGLPGETVEMVDDKLYINGEEQHESYLQGVKEEYRENGLNYTADFGPVKVPEGHVFVMGDNRPNSEDSREIGPVPFEAIVGRAELVFWPLSEVHMLHWGGEGT